MLGGMWGAAPNMMVRAVLLEWDLNKNMKEVKA